MNKNKFCFPEINITLTLLLLIIITSCSSSQIVDQKHLVLNGTDSYAAAVNNNDINPTTAMTIEMWIRLSSSPTTTKAIIGKNGFSSWLLGMNTNRTIAFRRVNDVLTSAGAIPLNTWTHIAVSYDQGLVLLYINGLLNASSASFGTSIPVTADSLYIGCDRQSGNLVGFFQGELDAIRLWKAARTGVQINETMRTEFTGTMNTSLPGRYNGLTFSTDFNLMRDMDESGTPQPIYFRGGFSYSAIMKSPMRHLDYNNNIYLDGSSYLVSKNQEPFNPSNAMTFCCWIKRDTIGGDATQVLASKSGPGRVDWAVYLTGSALTFRLDGPGGIHTINTAIAVTNKQWHHIAAVYSQTLQQMRTYVDGNLIGGGILNDAINNNPDSIYVGAQANNTTGPAINKFKGQIDAVQLYKSALTIDQIRNHMYENITGELMGPGCELSFDSYPNMYRAFGNSLSTFNYMGNIKIVSSHENNDLYSTSPLLRQDINFQGAAFQIKRTGFFIPDNAAVSDSLLVPVSAGGNISKLNVFIALNHTRIGDISLNLRSPSGTVVTLKPAASNTANDMVCIFDNSADSSLISGEQTQAPYSPALKPANSLTAFNGSNAAGYWRLTVVDNTPGNTGYMIAWGILPLIVTGTGNETTITEKFTLGQNYPNPFNPQTTISYSVSKEELVKITIFDVLGKEVQTVVNDIKKAGSYSFNFDASSVTSGIYFYKMEAGEFSDIKKMMVVK